MTTLGTVGETSSSRSLNRLIPCIVLLIALSGGDAMAQGSKSDYERAFAIRRTTEGKVLNARLTVNWLTNGTQLWFRRQTATNGSAEFVLVDAVTGTRKPAFDHAALATALAKASGRKVSATALTLEGLEFKQAGAAVRFRFAGEGWEFRPATGTVLAIKGASNALTDLTIGSLPRASTRTGGETSISFHNLSDTEVEIFWLDTAGARTSYGKLAAGAQRDQHTFSGHIWIAAANGRTMAAFEASDEPATAEIKTASPNTEEPAQRRARRTTPRGQSPDGKWTAFIKDNNVHLRDAADQKESALSTDGTADDPYNGEFYWSPDSLKLIATRATKAQEHRIHIVESSPKDQVQPKLLTFDYLKPGDVLAKPRPQLFNIASHKQLPVPSALFDNPFALSRQRWEPDSKRFTLLYNQRGHQVLRVLAIEADNGAVSTLVEEKSATFIDYAGKMFLQSIEPTRELVWMSERDGWNHLWLVDAANGSVKSQITKGEWVVRSVERVDETKRQVWFMAGGVRPGQDPYYLHLCRVNLDGSAFVILTEGDGNHTVNFSPDRNHFIDTWSRVDQAPAHELRRSEDGKLIAVLDTAESKALATTGWKTPERFVAKGRDGVTDIHGIILRPSNFDPARKYPVIENIYAGPHSAFVPKEFKPNFSHMSELAELGFILVQIDGMGTSHRSKKFHDVAWKNLADSGFPDRKLWIRAAAAKHPEMSISRVGIYGGSAGGQSSTRGMLDHGDFYKVCVSDCGCHDNRMDKIWWNELWMGWPVDDSYKRSSNVEDAHKLTGKLMLVVGEVDHNVDPASTMQVVNALIKADKDFDLLVIPGSDHGSAESNYGRRRRADYFVRHLMGREPRWE